MFCRLPVLMCMPVALMVCRPGPRLVQRVDKESFAAGLPLWFEENRGQAKASVRFVGRGPASRLTLDDSGEAVLQLPAASIRVRLVGAAPSLPEGLDVLPGHSSYLIGNDPSRWVQGAQHYRSVRYKQVYPGIDHVFYGNQRQVEHDFVIAPGADPGLIRMRFAGAARPRRNAAGDVTIDTPDGPVVQRRPVAYQEIDGKQNPVEARQVVTSRGDVRFEVGAYDRSRPLVMDPLVAATYLGAAGDDRGFGVSVDVLGNVYLTGLSNSTGFPATSGSRQTTYGGGNSDAFVAKFTPDLSSLIYCTFLGGSNTDVAQRIVADESGNALVAGYTASTNFPVTVGTSAIQGQIDLFFAKLDPTGRTLLYSTLVGGGNVESPFAVDVDPEGNLYAAGYTQSNNFPTTPGAYDNTFNGGEDGFVLKLNPAGSLLFSTYLGGSGNERIRGISWTATRQVYVTGTTFSTNFPVSGNAVQSALRGPSDAFLARLNPSGTALEFSTYYGGSGTEEVWGLTWTSSGEVTIGGYTSSTDFPNAPGKPALKYNGGANDGFVVTFGPRPSAGGSENLPDARQAVDGEITTRGAQLCGSAADEQVTGLLSLHTEIKVLGETTFPIRSMAAGQEKDTGRGFVGECSSNWKPTYFGKASTNGMQIDGYARAHLAITVDAGNNLDLPDARFAFQAVTKGGNEAAAAIYGIDPTSGLVQTINTRAEANREAYRLRTQFPTDHRPRLGELHSQVFAQSSISPNLRLEGIYWNDPSQPNAPDTPCTAPAGQTCFNRVGSLFGPGVNQNRNRFFFFGGDKSIFPHPNGNDLGIGAIKTGPFRGEQTQIEIEFWPGGVVNPRPDSAFASSSYLLARRKSLQVNLNQLTNLPCRGLNTPLFRSDSAPTGAENIRVSFDPLFNGAFLNLAGESLPGLSAGSGTRLLAAFNNVPNNVKIFVGTRSAGNPDAAALTQADALGAGPLKLITASSPLAGGISAVTLGPNGSGSATWEVLGSNVNGPLQFPIFVAYEDAPGTKEFTIRLSYAPLDTPGSNSFPVFDPNSGTTFSVQIPACGQSQVTVVSAASYAPGVAPNSIATAFGQGLASSTEVAASLPLPLTLAGTSVKLRDSNGAERLAPLFFASPDQINFLVPPETSPGAANLFIERAGDFVLGDGSLQVAPVAPALFTANSDGKGPPSGLAVRLPEDGSVKAVEVYRFNLTSGKYEPVPIDLGAPTDKTVLTMFGTGMRGRSSPSTVSVKIGGVEAPIEFVGPQGDYAGLDQINVVLPHSLEGRGEVDVVVTVDGKPANTVRINIH